MVVGNKEEMADESSSGKEIRARIFKESEGRIPLEIESAGFLEDSMYVKEGCTEMCERTGKQQRMTKLMCQLEQWPFSKAPMAPWLSEWISKWTCSKDIALR